ncbi:MAG: TetR/AcrR family transcriptional regulator [Gammaproteobacteria bacterium]|nr:TetR/AcrR family transcriptional regulator [Gammaproteobacteria bacterium]
MDAEPQNNAPGPKEGTATRQRGKTQVKKILRAARSILIDEGYAGLTIRKVARNLDISVGNLTYYFPNKEKLLRALIANLLDEYHRGYLKEQQRFPDDAHGRLLAYIEYLVADCDKSEVRALFFQIWGLATHSEVVNELRDQIYSLARGDAIELIASLHPDAPETEINSLAAIFIAMIEGLHVIGDLSDGVLQLPVDFQREFRNVVYETMVQGIDPDTQKGVNKHLPEALRRF